MCDCDGIADGGFGVSVIACIAAFVAGESQDANVAAAESFGEALVAAGGAVE